MTAPAVVGQDLLRDVPHLFGDKQVNGRTVNVERLTAELARELGPEIARVLTARRQVLASSAPVQQKYAFPQWDDTFEDADGHRRTFRQIVQGLLDNFLGRQTDLAWRLNDEVPIPDDAHPLQHPGLEVTGPQAPDMIINQVNADVAARMPDLEDASAAWFRPAGVPAQAPVGAFAGMDAERRFLAGEWDDRPYVVEKQGQRRAYRLAKPRGQRPAGFQRVPSIHVRDRHITVDGRPVPASIPSYLIYALNNFGALTNAGSGVYYYQPKIQTPQEALIVEKILATLEEAMGLRRGTIKIKALYEEGRAGLHLPAILWVWRARLIGTNVGRWDYLGSLIEMWKDERVFPDPQSIGMAAPNMIAYQRYNALLMLMAGMKDGRLTNAAPIGGMAAVMLYPTTDPYGRWKHNPKALRAMKLDKLRERLLGLIFVTDTPLPAGRSATLQELLDGRITGRLYDAYRQSWVATTDADYVAAGAAPLRAAVTGLQGMIDPSDSDLLQGLGLLNQDGRITPWVITPEQFDAPEKFLTPALWKNLYNVPQGEITIERIQHAFYMAANYGFQILNGNYAAAIDDYELGLRFMNDLATYRIDVAWLWTLCHHQAAITRDGHFRQGVLLDQDAAAVPAGTRMTPALFRQLWDCHHQWTAAFFAEQDRRGGPSRFDRSKAPIIMDILQRQLTSPRYIQHSARVLLTVAEAVGEERAQLLDAIFSPSREAVVEQVRAGRWHPGALEAHDYVHDIFI